MGRPDPPISNQGLPHDTEYADDVDLNDEVNLKRILPVATDVLKRWNLFVNEDKTDFTHVKMLNYKYPGVISYIVLLVGYLF